MNESPLTPPVLDVRCTEDYERLHRAGTAHIPLEKLDQRTHELPPREEPFIVFDVDEERAVKATDWLRARERNVFDTRFGEAWLHKGPTESGKSRVRLWRAHALLLEAIEIIHRIWPDATDYIALDLAAGCGRDTVQLALAGFSAIAWDILPDALNKCNELAFHNNVVVGILPRDLEAPLNPFTDDYGLICCFNYLHRPLMSWIRQSVRPGGFVVYETFVRPQRERFGKPANPRHILEPGELRSYFDDFEILVYREGPAGPRRIAASLIARRPMDESRSHEN